MTNEQKASIIALFNAACDDERKAMDGMDAAQKDRTWAKCASDHSFAVGKQSAIDSMVDILGYALIRNDEGFAYEISPVDE